MADERRRGGDGHEVFVERWRVLSELTGAFAGEYEAEQDANVHRDNLNAECRRNDIRHLGEYMRYRVVGPVEVLDERATRRARIATMKVERKDAADDDVREALDKALKRAGDELDELDRREERRRKERG